MYARTSTPHPTLCPSPPTCLAPPGTGPYGTGHPTQLPGERISTRAYCPPRPPAQEPVRLGTGHAPQLLVSHGRKKGAGTVSLGKSGEDGGEEQVNHLCLSSPHPHLYPANVGRLS